VTLDEHVTDVVEQPEQVEPADAREDGDPESTGQENEPADRRTNAEQVADALTAKLEQSLTADRSQERAREIAARMAEIERAIAAQPDPQFQTEADELTYHRQQRKMLRDIHATEVRIGARLDEFSQRVGRRISRDDERLAMDNPEAFETSLRAIEREERLRARQAPHRRDTHRFDGGSSGAHSTFNLKKFENTGQTFEALRARSAARGDR
jgi:hypothetical protein